LALDELDNMMCDIIGTVQQLEHDLLAVSDTGDGLLTLEARISSVQV